MTAGPEGVAITPEGTLMVLDGLPESAFILQEIRACGTTAVSMVAPTSRARRLASRLMPPYLRHADAIVGLPDGVGERADLIVVPESELGIEEGRWLQRHRPGARVIMWFWNPVSEPLALAAQERGIEVWAFDPSDAARIKGVRLNTQYWFASQVPDPREKLWDVSFVGRDKGRGQTIQVLESALRGRGLTTNFQIVAPPSRLPWKQSAESWIPYREVIEQSARSRAVLDIVQQGQTGMTLRAMEALYLEVKLITNNAAMLQDPHYPQDNVYLLEGTELPGLEDFMSRPIAPTSEMVREFYSFPAWLRRFGTGIS